MKIWMYWEGPLPEWIRLCQESIKKHSGGEFIILDDKSFDQIRTEDRDIPIEKLYVAHRADFIRAYVLKHFGGLWFDSDCIVMFDLKPLLETCKSWDFIAYKQQSGRLSNSLLGCKEDSITANDFYSAIVAKLRKALKINWTEIGETCLYIAYAKKLPRLRLSTECVCPYCWSNNAPFLKKKTDEQHSKNYNPHALCYMMSNHSIKWLKGIDDILDDDTLFSFLIRKSNENCIHS